MAKGKYSIVDRLRLGELWDSFIGLGPREQIMAGAGAAFVVLLLIVIPISCASSKLGGMEKQISSHEKDVAQIMDKITEYNQAQAKIDKLEKNIKPKSEVQLTTRLEALATRSGIGGNIDSLKEKPGTPGEDYEELVVAVRVSKLSLNQVIEFLYGIESQKEIHMKISRLQLKPRYDNRGQFDVSFEVSTLVSTVQGEEG
jgi:general secretion pathway protein M